MWARRSANHRIGFLFFLVLLSLSCTLWSVGQERETNNHNINNNYYIEPAAVSTEKDHSNHQHQHSPISTNNNHHDEPNYEINRLLDISNFTYILDSYDTCNARHQDSGGSLTLLVLVHSAPMNANKRQRIRESWASVNQDEMRTVFALGQVNDRDLQQRLEREQSLHGDLLQGSFLDSYRNLSYKHAMVLKFATERCSRVPYVLKCDDDVFVNTPRLLRILEKRLEQQNYETDEENNDLFKLNVNSESIKTKIGQDLSYKISEKHQSSDAISIAETMIEIFGDKSKNIGGVQDDNFIYCVTNENAWVRRSYRSKWRVSPFEYPSRTYPTYCSGGFVLYPRSVVRMLYRGAGLGRDRSDPESDERSDRVRDTLDDRERDPIRDRMSDRLSGGLNNRLNGRLSDGVHNRLSDGLSDRERDLIRDRMSDRISDGLSDRMSDRLSDRERDLKRDKSRNDIHNRDLIRDQSRDLRRYQSRNDIIRDQSRDGSPNMIQNQSHNAIHDRLRGTLHNQLRGLTHDPTYDQSRDPSHNALHDPLRDGTDGQSNNPIRDVTKDQSQNIIRDHKKPHDPTHKPNQLYNTKHDQSHNQSVLWIDDVHFTGTLAERLGINRRNAKRKQLTTEQLIDIINGYKKTLSKNGSRSYRGNIADNLVVQNWLLAPWDISDENVKLLWDIVMEYSTRDYR